MYDIDRIKNYILLLKREHKLSITLHFTEDGFSIQNELVTFNIHDNSHCVLIKTSPEALHHCIERQCKITEKCRDGSFCGVCYAGVKEYIYPITAPDRTVGFVCVSGYRCDNADSHLAKTAERYGIPLHQLEQTYASLKEDMPEKEWVDALILPLCDMLELAITKTDRARHQTLTERTIQYLKRNRATSISLDDVCANLSCSRSLVSHSFKRQTGKSIREYLTELRVEDAKSFLSHSDLTVTEIAFSVGFSDSNYFSNVFKRQVGISPMAYRRKTRDKQV